MLFMTPMSNRLNPLPPVRLSGASISRQSCKTFKGRCVKDGLSKERSLPNRRRRQFKPRWSLKMRTSCLVATKNVSRWTISPRCRSLKRQTTRSQLQAHSLCATQRAYSIGKPSWSKYWKLIRPTMLGTTTWIGARSEWTSKQGPSKTYARSMSSWMWRWGRWALMKKSSLWTRGF